MGADLFNLTSGPITEFSQGASWAGIGEPWHQGQMIVRPNIVWLILTFDEIIIFSRVYKVAQFPFVLL